MRAYLYYVRCGLAAGTFEDAEALYGDHLAIERSLKDVSVGSSAGYEVLTSPDSSE